ncbi:PAS domain-containing hybrid sensor histidine kinase/response regulator [Lysobacter terrae]
MTQGLRPAADIVGKVCSGDDIPFRLLVESVPDYAIFMLDPQGHICSWNRGAQSIKGYSADEVIGRHFSLFYPPEKVAAGWPDHELTMARALGRFEDEGWRVRKDGSRFWANVIISRIDNPNGTLRGFTKVTRDLTDRREHEEQLRRSEERFRLLVEGVRDYAIFMLDTQGRVASWNPGAELIKGYRAGEIIGQHFSVFYTPEALAKNWPARELEIALAEGRIEDEGWRVRKDGTRFWANVIISALYDGDGNHAGFVKITRDLTSHRRIRALEDEGERLTTFLAMLGHELRNPLAPIANAVSIMHMEPIESPAVKSCRDVIERQLGQLSRLVDDLLDISRITKGKIRLLQQTLDLRAALADAVETVDVQARRRSQSLYVETTATPAWVVGDRVRLVQVLSNLLHNAVKFTQPHGQISAKLRRLEGQVEIVIRDNGPGIAPEKIADIFNPFVQGDQDAARSHGGLGLGLSLVQQLVTLHRGEVSASSSGQPGEGAEFRIRLPAAAEPGFRAPENAPAAQVASRRLLIVDDNRDAADSMRMLLQHSGYLCEAVYDAASALEATRAATYDAILIDLGLPDIDGFELGRRLNEELPQPTPLIAVTGYGQAGDMSATREAGFHAHLTKPLAAEQITHILRALFN